MGIHGLPAFIKNRTNAVSIINISMFKGKRIALDVSNYLYKYKYKETKYGTKVIVSFYYLIKSLRQNGVHAVMVFDGKPPVEKTNTLKRRETQKISRRQKIEDLQKAISLYEKYKAGDKTIDTNTFLIDLEDFKSETQLEELINDPVELIAIEKAKEKLDQFNASDIRITPQDFEEIKQLVTKAGAKYIQATGETEPLCYSLYKSGEIDAVISEDSDLLVYGMKNLILEYNIKNGDCFLMDLGKILSELELTQEQFVDFCIMCGTDYGDNIRGIGPVKAYDLISRYNTIENIRTVIGKAPEGFKKSRELFINVPPPQQVEYWNSSCDRSFAQFIFELGIREDPTDIFRSVKVIFEEETKET